MKTRISLFVIALLFATLGASSASAEVDKAKLVGTWTGQLTAYVHGQENQVTFEMNLKADGTYAVVSKGKTDRGEYTVKDDRVVLAEKGKSRKVSLVNLVLTDDTFSGDFEFDEDANNRPVSIVISFNMKRK